MKTVKTKFEAIEKARDWAKKNKNTPHFITKIVSKPKDFCFCGFGNVIQVCMSDNYKTNELSFKLEYILCANPQCEN